MTLRGEIAQETITKGGESVRWRLSRTSEGWLVTVDLFGTHETACRLHRLSPDTSLVEARVTARTKAQAVLDGRLRAKWGESP